MKNEIKYKCGCVGYSVEGLLCDVKMCKNHLIRYRADDLTLWQIIDLIQSDNMELSDNGTYKIMTKR